jgi:hypothetical protein
MYCHYPEAFLETLMYVNNVTMYYAVAKITNPVIHGSMRSESPGSYILSNFTSHIYFESNEAASIVTLLASKNWVPLTTVDRYLMWLMHCWL